MNELVPQLVFYTFAGLTAFSALMVVTQNNPVRCVLFLVLTFFASSVLWVMAYAEFLALILVLVYVGAVMTLFLFVVMMLNIDSESRRHHFWRYLPFGLIIVALLTSLLLIAVPDGVFNQSAAHRQWVESTTVQTLMEDEGSRLPLPLSDAQQLGSVLYTDYVLAFELAAVILLVAIVAAITLVHRKPRQSKRQDVVQQIMIKASERLTMVRMKSEK